ALIVQLSLTRHLVSLARFQSTMKNWRESLAESPGSSEGLKFGQDFVPVSSIAQQFYCEVKVEHQFVHGDIPTEAKGVGTELHEQILFMEKVRVEDLIDHIAGLPRLTASFVLHGKVGAMEVVGIPDAIVFENSKPRWVVELKTTGGDPSRLWKDQELQARIYGLLLENMGFDCSDLELAVVRWRQKDAKEVKQKEEMLSMITRSLFDGTSRALEARLGTKFFLFPHDKAQAEVAVRWAQDFWLGKREPVPTDNPGKCRVCEYNSLCRFNLSGQ
ncbi:MAG TPA: PD-(D/E)XK nuclease family protein, partial [Nitrososphaerales archaeon]|nr:PD-(D/E)XK nuclease family protein [Nitrososphaerales archaeon]